MSAIVPFSKGILNLDVWIQNYTACLQRCGPNAVGSNPASCIFSASRKGISWTWGILRQKITKFVPFGDVLTPKITKVVQNDTKSRFEPANAIWFQFFLPSKSEGRPAASQIGRGRELPPDPPLELEVSLRFRLLPNFLRRFAKTLKKKFRQNFFQIFFFFIFSIFFFFL